MKTLEYNICILINSTLLSGSFLLIHTKLITSVELQKDSFKLHKIYDQNSLDGLNPCFKLKKNNRSTTEHCGTLLV